MNNKQYLIAFLGVLTTAVLAYSVQTSRSETEKANENFNKLTLQSIKQAANIAENGKMVKQILEKISQQQLQDTIQNSADNTLKPVNSGLDLKLTKLNADLSFLKQQIKDLKNIEPQPASNLPTAAETDNSFQNIQAERQSIEEKMRAEIKTMESTYETALYTGKDDINWTSDIETKLNGLISENKIGDNVQLTKVDCRTSLCKINFSQASNSSLNDEALMPSFGNATVYLNKAESSIQGQEEYVMYVSREGEQLPPIERN